MRSHTESWRIVSCLVSRVSCLEFNYLKYLVATILCFNVCNHSPYTVFIPLAFDREHVS